jgi:hypothetical protein
VIAVKIKQINFYLAHHLTVSSREANVGQWACILTIAKACTHLSTPEESKAELTLAVGIEHVITIDRWRPNQSAMH